MKLILIFKDGELFKQLQYKTKGVAKKHYSHFKKHGFLDSNTGEVITNLIFELI